jgi:GDP-L-fucose synthase
MIQAPLPSTIFVAGHQGMAGTALMRRFATTATQLITIDRDRLDFRDGSATCDFLKAHRPEAVVIAAARTGGIAANQASPVEFMSDNLRIAVNLIDASYRFGVQRLLFLGSTCIYPRECDQPITEDALLTGPLEPTNEAYSLAKIAGVKLCQYYRHQYGVTYHSVMPTNLYGPRDRYDAESSHVVAALLRRFHEARQSGANEVAIWGTGQPRRDFLHVDDLADAIVHLLGMANPPDWVNVGTGTDLSVMELAHKIACVVGYRGRIVTDPSRPDGTPQKRTDVTRLHQLGWHHQIDLDEGLSRTYESFLTESRSGRLRSTPSGQPIAEQSG